MMKESTLKTIIESSSSLKNISISNISTTGNSTGRVSGIFSHGDGDNFVGDGEGSSPNNFSTIDNAKMASSSHLHQKTRITYSNKKLYGRQKELQQLLQRYEQICVERMRRLKIIQQQQQRRQQQQRQQQQRQRQEEGNGNGNTTPAVDKAETNKPSSIKQSPPSSSSSPTDHDIEPVIKTLFVSGYSGKGKTALIEEFVRMINKQQQQQQDSQHRISKSEDHDNNGDGNHDDDDEENTITNTGNSNSQATLLPCFFLQGKFEQQQNTTPYIALIQAMNPIVNPYYNWRMEMGRKLL